ncbi:MAG: IS110 family transposase [Thiolinea sp.]
MKSAIITIDLAKSVFELAIANSHHRIKARKRLNLASFTTFMHQQPPSIIVMEACGSAHHWGRTFRGAGHEVVMLPAHYVRAYRRRHKTDRADCEALLEAYRCEGIKPVPVKSIEQQELQQLHRLREQWKRTRLARMNFIRGVLREQGIPLPEGQSSALKEVHVHLNNLSLITLQLLQPVLDELKQMEANIQTIEKQLALFTRKNPNVQRLRTVPGIGLLTSTAMVASIGKPDYFQGGRQLSSWLGITPRENSSGNRRHLGGITKQGNTYLRTLLIHGARTVLTFAKKAIKAGKPLNRLQHWAINLEKRVGHNKAAVAIANKLARIAWACWKNEANYQVDYGSAS